MGQYCDSKKLELHWLQWLMASATPQLESFRTAGLLWSKPAPQCTSLRTPTLDHCLALGIPTYFKSSNGQLEDDALPTDTQLSLLSGAKMHRLAIPYYQLLVVIPTLYREQYIREIPTKQSWDYIVNDVSKICHGFSLRFNLASESEREELAHDALLQVLTKIQTKRLVYTPGRAPVFNLLTTTVHRCMCTTLAKNTKRRGNLLKLAIGLQTGVIPQKTRTLSLPTGTTIGSGRRHSVNILSLEEVR